MPRPRRTTARAKPHSKAARARRDAAAMTPDQAWAADLRERMLADCHPFQRDAVLDPAKRISYLVGRGGGKTTAARVRALILITSISRAKVAYVATSRPEAERLNWEPLKQLIEGLGESDSFEFSESKMTCTCKRTGGTYQFFGADDKKEIGKLRGQPFNEFQVDEAASHDLVLLDWMLNRIIGPRLGERNGGILILGTPGHVLSGLFFDVTRPGGEAHRPYSQRKAPAFKDWIGWSSHAWNAPQVLALAGAAKKYVALALNWADALVTKAREKWSDDHPVWLREYMGLWAADNTTTMYAYQAFVPEGQPDAGKPWNQWNPVGEHPWAKEFEWGEAIPEDAWPRALAAALDFAKKAIAALPAGISDWLYGYGQDLGSRDPYALNIAALSPSDPERRVFHVFAFSRRRMYARLIAELLIGAEAAGQAARGENYATMGGLFGITDWPPAIVADLAGLGQTLLDELRKVYFVAMKAAQKAGKFGAIEVVNGDLADGRQRILAGSPLETQLATLQWKPDEYGVPKEDRSARNDQADSWTYIRTEIGTMFGAAPPPAKDDDRKRTPRDQTAKPAAKRADDPHARATPTGEFDSLLAGDDWSGLQ